MAEVTEAMVNSPDDVYVERSLVRPVKGGPAA
jgi:hypothetical protein